MPPRHRRSPLVQQCLAAFVCAILLLRQNIYANDATIPPFDNVVSNIAADVGEEITTNSYSGTGDIISNAGSKPANIGVLTNAKDLVFDNGTDKIEATSAGLAGGFIYYDDTDPFAGKITNGGIAAASGSFAVGVGFLSDVDFTTQTFTFADIAGTSSTAKSVITLGDIGVTGLQAVGFRAANVNHATITIEDITATGSSTSGGAAAGLWLGNITNSTITLGDISVSSYSDASAGPAAVGVIVQGSLDTKSTFTINDVTVERTGGDGGATGVVFNEGANGSVTVKGEVKVSGAGAGGGGSQGFGLYAANFTNLTVKNSIEVSNDFAESYGIRTEAINSDGIIHPVGDSKITIDTSDIDDLSITGGTASIRLDGTKDAVTIQGDKTFTNGGNEFILEGVETLAILTNAELTNTVITDGTLVISPATSSSDPVTVLLGDHTAGASDVAQEYETIIIYAKATLDIDHALVKLTNDDSNVVDMTIYGTLRVAGSLGKTGIYKGTLTPDGSLLEKTKLFIDSGKIEIYEGLADQTPFLDAVTVDAVIGQYGGEISVETGLTFRSGMVGSSGTGSNVKKSGAGTWQVQTVDLGVGTFLIDGGTVEFQDTLNANKLEIAAGNVVLEKTGNVIALLQSKSGTNVTAYADQTLQTVDIAGTYNGGGNDLTITKGGNISGYITDAGIFKLTAGTLYLTVRDNVSTIRADELVVESGAQIKAAVGTDNGTYHKVIEAASISQATLDRLNTGKTALNRSVWNWNDASRTSLDLLVQVLTLPEYIQGNYGGKVSNNAGKIGNLIDQAVKSDPDLESELEGLSKDELDRVIRSALGGELIGDAVRFAMWQPYRHVFRHLDEAAPLRSPFANYQPMTTRGQIREGFNVWFNPYAGAENAKSKDDVPTYDGYKLTRYGFMLGSDVDLYNYTVAGVLFSYGKPGVSNDLGKITADDYMVGIYLRTPILWDVTANMMLGYGKQSYLYKNAFSRESKYDGNSIYGSFELSREWAFSFCQLKPVLAIDFQETMVDAFTADIPHLGWVTYEPSSLDQLAIRLGLDGKWWRLRSRLQYVRVLSGEGYADTLTSFRGTAAAIRGVEWGKDWLNVGFGGEILSARHWRIFADYDFEAGKNTTSHTGSFNTVFTW